MKINHNYKNSLAFAQSGTMITDDIYKKLLENCFSVLTRKEETYSINTLFNSKPDVIKAFYTALLAVSAEFARHNANKEEIQQFMTNDCSFSLQRAKVFVELFEKNRRGIEISLLRIGNCLPHLTNVKWKIDYIVKSNVVDQSDGPLFRICLVSEEYDTETENKIIKNVNFSCTSQELQDLVYKLKDAVRHCNFTHRIF